MNKREYKYYSPVIDIETYIYYKFEEEKIAEELKKGNVEALYDFISFIQSAFSDAIESLKDDILNNKDKKSALQAVSEFDEKVDKMSHRMIKTVKSYLELLHGKDMMNYYGNLA